MAKMSNAELNMAEVAATMVATLMNATDILSVRAMMNTDTCRYEPEIHHSFKNFVELFGNGECFVKERDCEQFPFEMFTIRNGVRHFALAGEEQVKRYNDEHR